MALRRLETIRVKNKGRLDKKHRLCLNKIEEANWVIVHDNNHDNQHNSMRKFVDGGLDLLYVVTRENETPFTTSPNSTKQG